MIIDPNTYCVKKIANRFRAIKSYKRGQPFINAKPVELNLEITNYCNLSCPMCSKKGSKRQLGFMEMSLFKNIIGQVKDYIELVDLSGGNGEPLMHPELPEMVGYCIENDLRVLLSTNATLLKNTVASKLINDFTPDILILSLDGATKRSHEQIRKGSIYEKTIGNVYQFLNEKKKNGLNKPYVITQMILMPGNYSDVPLFLKRWRGEKGVDCVRLKKFVGFYGAEEMPTANSIINKIKYSSCIIPWRQISISHDGKMALCCLDADFSQIIGNVNTSSVDALWNSTQMKEYRTLLASGNKNSISLCRDCIPVKVNMASAIGLIMFDNLTVSKVIPIIEKHLLRLKIKPY